jgi:hypothetical protein
MDHRAARPRSEVHHRLSKPLSGRAPAAHSGLGDRGNPGRGIDLKALAAGCVADYANYKSAKKSAGRLDIQKIPGINHPVFKDKPVNYDPREVWVHDLFTQRGEYNVFHEYYHELVEALFKGGVSRNIYCVNIDA